MKTVVSIVIVLCLCSSRTMCACILYCNADSESCLCYLSYGQLIENLRYTNASLVNVTLQSHYLSEVVKFQNLSRTLLSLRISGEGSTITCANSNAGFLFDDVQKLNFVDITITNCGFNSTIPSRTSEEFQSAVFIVSQSEVVVSNVNIINSFGSGMTVFITGGGAVINGSTFHNNSVHTGNGGNGFYLLLLNSSNSKTIFHNCSFTNNKAGATGQSRVAIRFGVGGGLYVSVAGNSSNNTVLLNESAVMYNEAVWGGGLFFQYHGVFPELNTIDVVHSNIIGNHVFRYGGGGVDIGYVLSNQFSTTTSYNTIAFRYTRFYQNSAVQFGGGSSIFGTRSLDVGNGSYHITFENCEWRSNSAVSGSAFDIAPIFYTILGKGVFPSICFTNCRFVSNYVMTVKHDLGSGIAFSKIGTGTISAEGFQLAFQGETVFDSNKGTALILSSVTVDFLAGSRVHFQNNIGRNGGAIAMYGLSLIVVESNSSMWFLSNRGRFKGGAFYVGTNDIQDYSASRTCFILFNGEPENRHNISFYFQNNTVGRVGRDVYASSTQACFESNSMEDNSRKDPFELIGDVEAIDFDLVTNAVNFSVNTNCSSCLSEIVPGEMYYKIPITAMDEFGQTKSIIYEVINEVPEAPIRPRRNFITQNQVQFIGKTGESSTFRIESAVYMLEFNITSSISCPPGYMLYDNRSCICGAQSYFGVAFCNMTGAYVINGFWIGLCSDGENDLCTAHCPLGFCSYSQQLVKETYVHLIPSKVSELNEFSCGTSRRGIVCGSCQVNHSAYYHSYKYTCGKNELCRYGILLYIVSELLPVTVMFLIVIFFEISFTSGQVNGFILFAQVLDSISIDANGVIGFPHALQVTTDIHRFLYRTFNFDFFSIERLSFCLWQGATVLDAMAMKYITVFYAILLLILVVVIMNFWKCSKRVSYFFRYRTLKSTVIHGLTAFVVICYSQCARISFQILTPTVLYTFNYRVVRRVVFRRGDFSAFDLDHLVYAIPAMIILAVMSLVPIFLILYPSIFKVLSYCKLNESVFATILSRFFPIPLLDAFQSSFKDKYRLFAGFYFLYRIFALLSYAFSKTLLIFYTLVELQLVLILALHAIVQPYKNQWHNVVDTLIFANLAIINGITMYNYIAIIDAYGRNKRGVLDVTASIQAFLIFLPLLVLVAYMVVAIARKVKARLVMDMPSDSNLIDSLDLPPLRGADEETNFVKTAKQPFLSKYNGDTRYTTSTSDTY